MENSNCICVRPLVHDWRTRHSSATGLTTLSAVRFLRPKSPGIIDNVGLPASSINLSYSISAPVGTADADIQVELSENHHPTAQYVRALRVKLSHDFPGVSFYSIPTDIVSQILDFGLPAPIDIQVSGRNLTANRAFADNLFNQLKFVPGTVDLRVQQVFDQPSLHIDIDRTKAQEIGYSARDVAQNVLISLGGSFQDRLPVTGLTRGRV